MQLRRGGIFFSNHFITNFSHNVPVKKNPENRSTFWRSYGQKFAAYFLGTVYVSR